MITLRRSIERHHVQQGKHEIWRTFNPGTCPVPSADDPGILIDFTEMLLGPMEVCKPHPEEEVEIITYVFRGTLAQEDSTGNSGVIRAGEFQRMIMGRGALHKETNASRSDLAHIFRIYLRPSEVGLDCGSEHKRFSTAQRRNEQCVIASPDGRRGSLRTRQDAVIYSSLLNPGHHIIHELLPGRSAWLHVICGELATLDIILSQGDGVGVTMEPSISLTAQDYTETLLVDLGPTPRSLASGVLP